MDLLVIDEISMVRADLLDAVDVRQSIRPEIFILERNPVIIISLNPNPRKNS
jgi:hypothetical protein